MATATTSAPTDLPRRHEVTKDRPRYSSCLRAFVADPPSFEDMGVSFPRKRRFDILRRRREQREGVDDLLLVAEIAERIEQVRGAHQLRDRRDGDFSLVGR